MERGNAVTETVVSHRKLVIGWLYGATMNIYGDRGNVLAIQQRATWRGIDVEVRQIGMGEPIPDDIDIFFWGGGQDQEQVAVSKDIHGEKGEALKAAVEDGAAAPPDFSPDHFLQPSLIFPSPSTSP